MADQSVSCLSFFVIAIILLSQSLVMDARPQSIQEPHVTLSSEGHEYEEAQKVTEYWMTSETNSDTTIETTTPSLSDPLALRSNKIGQYLLLNFYKRRTGAVLSVLNKILPIIKNVRQNVTTMLQPPKNTSNDDDDDDNVSLKVYKEANQFLDANMDQIEGTMDHNRIIRQTFSDIINETEHKLTGIEQTFDIVLNERVPKRHENDLLLLSPFAACNGVMSIASSTMLTYARKTREGSDSLKKQICVWLLYSSNTQVQMTLVLRSLEQGLGRENGTVLGVHKNPDNVGSAFMRRVVGRGDLNEEVGNGNVFVVVFSTTNGLGNPGFQLEVKVSHGQIADEIKGHLLPQLVDGQGTHKYEASISTYANNKAYFVLCPESGRPLNVSLTTDDMRSEYDRLNVFKFAADSQKFQLAYEFTGNSYQKKVTDLGVVVNPIVFYYFNTFRGGRSSPKMTILYQGWK